MQSKRLLGALLTGAAIAAAAPAAASAQVQVGSSGWLWGNPLPQGNTIRSMSFSGSTGFAAGDFGTLLKTLDGGATWSGLPVGTFQSLSLVQAVDANTVIAGGGCVARRSDDGGTSFTRITFTARESKCAQPLAGLSFVTPTVGWLMLADGTVNQTNNGGTEFIQRTAVPGTSAAGGQAKPTDIAFVSATVGYAVSSEGKIYQTSDSGQAWKVVNDTQRKVNDITFVTPLEGFAVGDGGLFLHTSDGGTTWVAKDVGAGAQNLTSVRCANDKLCIVATEKGDQLVRTPDAGETASLVSPSTDAIFAAAFSSPTQVAAAGARGSSVVSSDGGLNFTAVGGRLTGKYFGIRAGLTAGTAYAPGDNGSLARTADGGKTWTRGNVTTSEDVRDVSFPTPTVGYALDTSGEVFKTTSGGDAWSTLSTGTTAVANAIFAPDADTVMTIGGRGIRRSSAGGEFQQVKGGAVAKTPLQSVDRAGSAIFSWGSQDVIRSVDKGKTWSVVLKPGKYVKKGKKKVNRLGIAQVDFSSATSGFALDSFGRVWRTRNGGKTWTYLPGTGTEEAYGMAFSSATSGYLVIAGFGDTPRGGFLMRTTDGGATWHPQFVVNDVISPFGVASPSGGTDYLLGGESGLLSSKTGGDAGAKSSLSISTKTPKPKKPTKITITGKLSPASGQERVTVSYQRPGDTEWVHQTVNSASDGGFTTSWSVAKGKNLFVAQWAGSFKAAGDGSAVLTVTVGKKKK